MTRLSRREFLQYSLCLPPLLTFGLPSLAPQSPQPQSLTSPVRVLSHREYLEAMRATISQKKLTKFVADFKSLMANTARACVLDNGYWVVPGRAYAMYYFVRDSFWVLAALGDKRLSAIAADVFRAYQATTLDGHITTALDRRGLPWRNGLTMATSGSRDDESTLMFVLHNYVLKTLGGSVDAAALRRAFAFIQTRVRDGRYVTTGETRTGAGYDGANQVGTYHYWADTFRPAGATLATPEVISYTQGLLCVALRCLEALGVAIGAGTRTLAEQRYAALVNPLDHVSLPQREGTTIMDVSALVGEALSLYFFDTSLLPTARVLATLNRLTPVRYPDKTFLGFKVISDYFGAYRPAAEFGSAPYKVPGHYQNGGSWLLYDALALYCGVRHQAPQAKELLTQRLASEVRRSRASHEFLSTNPGSLGFADPFKDGYGWNAFVLRLLP